MAPIVLVVDDDRSVHFIVSKIAQTVNCEILSAYDGEHGWQMIRELHPDMVLCDWVMPKMDGLELCHRVKQTPDTASTYFIVFTSKVQREDRIAALEAGAEEFLNKPVDPIELQARLKTGLRIVSYQQKLEHLSLTDELTGLPNRRAFTNDIARELYRAERKKDPLALLLLDVDDFKTVNDTHGHNVGDILLSVVGKAIKKAFRRSDMSYRIGGDEFAVVLPDGDIPAEPVKERLAVALADHNEPGLKGIIPRVSVGFHVKGPNETIAVEEFLHLADEKMYEDKRSRKADKPLQQRAEVATAKS